MYEGRKTKERKKKEEQRGKEKRERGREHTAHTTYTQPLPPRLSFLCSLPLFLSAFCSLPLPLPSAPWLLALPCRSPS